MSASPKMKFPKRFLWGVSTSAHQIEGGTYNQWTVWEQEHAAALAAKAPYQYADLDVWPKIKMSAVNPANYISGGAAGHISRYEQDFGLARKLNLNAFRFSIEWSRVQPEQDVWDVGAIAHYKKYIASMRASGLEPVMTLFHFTLPIWFSDMGGFAQRSNVKYFVAFAERMLEELGTSVRFIVTVNEPEIYAAESYMSGHWPPMVDSKRVAWSVLRNLAYAHNKIADMAHAKNERYKLSVATNSAYVYAGDDAWLTVRSANWRQFMSDDYFLRKVVKRCDFLAVNYYFSSRIYGYREHNPNVRVSDIGWDMQPQDIKHVLERLYDKYHKPLMVTENGVADSDDAYRKWWLAHTLAALSEVIAAKIPVIGYLHWSLLDNFEWDKGFWPRFGLYEVDYKTLARTPRPSATWYAKAVKKIREG